MLVRFLRDYRGKLTAENFHRAGETVDLPSGEALALLASAVVIIDPAAQESQPAKQKRGKRG